MHEIEESGERAYLSRSEVELELARLALAVMRSAPASFYEMGANSVRDEDELPAEVASRLLSRTRPEHRPFVESRLLELARCLAGVRADGAHEWLNLTLDLPARVQPQLPEASAPVPERRQQR